VKAKYYGNNHIYLKNSSGECVFARSCYSKKSMLCWKHSLSEMICFQSVNLFRASNFNHYPANLQILMK